MVTKSVSSSYELKWSYTYFAFPEDNQAQMSFGGSFFFPY